MNVLSPKIIYGTAWKGERTTHLVINAFLQGFRAVDTGESHTGGMTVIVSDAAHSPPPPACQPKHYREDLVGEALDVLRRKHDIKRSEIYIQTKFTPVGGHDLSKPIPYNVNDTVQDQIAASLQTSLRNLRTSYVDSCLLHSPLKTMQATLEAWRALMSAQDAGTVRKIGVSNVYDVRVLAALGELRKVQVVQNRWYEGNMWDPQVWRYCKEQEIEYQSFWTLSGSTTLLTHPAVATISSRLDVTPAQVIFKLVQLNNIVPLTGTTNELHMQQDLAAERTVFGEDVENEIRDVTEFIWGR